MSCSNDNDSFMDVDNFREEIINTLKLSVSDHKLQELKRHVSSHVNTRTLLALFEENALFNTTLEGKNDLVKKLLDMGANPNHFSSYPPHIVTAVRNSNMSVLCMLVQAGADVNMQDFNGETALMMTILPRNYRYFYYLIRNGANVNEQRYDGFTALHIAVTQKREDFIYRLLEEHADFNIISKTGYSPLAFAMKYRFFEIAEILLKAGAAITRHSGKFFRSAVTGKKYELVNMLISHGMNVDGKSNSSCTPLMFAAAEGDTKMMSLLINAGANIHKQAGKNGINAISCAVSCGHLNAVILLVACGAKVNKRIRHVFHLESLLIFAARRGNEQIVAVLLAKGAKIHHRDFQGKTAYDIAVHFKYPKVAEMIKNSPNLLEIMCFMRSQIQRFQEEDGLQKDKLK